MLPTGERHDITFIPPDLKIQPSWRSRFEVLMTKAYENKNPSDNDLEVFESFPEFRLAVGLAPLPDEPPTAPSPSA